jgi:hypothetical protein
MFLGSGNFNTQWRMPIQMRETPQASTKPTATNDNLSSSEQSESAAINSQETEVGRLKSKARWPNWLNIALLIVGGIIALLIGFNSLWLRSATAAVSASEGSLTQLRVAKVNADSQREINRARQDAEDRLKLETTRVEGEAGKKIEDARAEAGVKIEQARGDADTKIAEAKRETEEVRNQNLATESRLEEEKFTRLNLAKSLARRVIPHVVVGGKSNFDILKPFSDIQAFIEFAPDREPSRAAQELEKALSTSGWKVVSVKPNPELLSDFWEGVAVSPYSPRIGGLPIDQTWALMYATKKPNEAASALVRFLDNNNWVVRRFPAFGEEIPPNTIRVRVGYKPEPRFLTPAEEEFEKTTGQTEKPLPRQRTEPRRITAAQRGAIFKSLAGLPKNMNIVVPVEIRCPENNAEACSFADQIADVLREATWPIKDNVVIRDRDFPRRLTGIRVRSQWTDQFFGGGALKDAFKSAGFDVELKVEIVTRSEPLQIFVAW